MKFHIGKLENLKRGVILVSYDPNLVVQDEEFVNQFLPKQELDIKQLVKDKVLQALVQGRRHIATETLSKYVNTLEKIYSLRDDKKEELWIYKDGIYIPEGKSYIKEICREFLGSAFTERFCNEVISKISVDNLINHDDFFNNIYLDEIPVLNGILNLRTRKLIDFTPEKIFFTKINAKYDPDKDCSKIKGFFKEILKEEDYPGMQELFGFCLWKENFTETSFLFRAGGGNGKSKTIDIIKNFLNPSNCVSVPLSQLEDGGSFKIIELHHKLVNCAGELSKSALQETDIFKSLTGRDTITADRKFLRPITFVNYAKMIFNANDRPPTYDLSDGFFRRWIVFHFKKKFVSKEKYETIPENERVNFGIKDPNIVQKLCDPDEFSGLLNWALDGLSRLLLNKEFSNTKSTEDTRDEWLKDSNNFVVFFEKNLELSRGHLVSKDDLRNVYSEFCEVNGLKPVSDKAILWYLQTKGVTSSRRTKDFGSNHSEQIHCFIGCRFKVDTVDVRGWSNPLINDQEVIEELKILHDKVV
jgi:putative DNA primase/helicase